MWWNKSHVEKNKKDRNKRKEGRTKQHETGKGNKMKD